MTQDGRISGYTDVQLCLVAPVNESVTADGKPIYFWADGSVTWRRKNPSVEDVATAKKIVDSAIEENIWFPDYLHEMARWNG